MSELEVAAALSVMEVGTVLRSETTGVIWLRRPSEYDTEWRGTHGGNASSLALARREVPLVVMADSDQRLAGPGVGVNGTTGTSAEAELLDFEPAKANERRMLDLLYARYCRPQPFGPPRFVGADHVRNSPTFAGGICDFMAVDTWRGYSVHGFEVKTSRSDWLRELAQPHKCEVFRPYCHRWWLVVSDSAIVRDDLPEGWGLIALRGQRLIQVTEAPALTPEPMPASMNIALLRAVAQTVQRHAEAAS